MDELFKLLTIGQDYLWFVVIVLWATVGVLQLRTKGLSVERSQGWVWGSVVCWVVVGLAEWVMFASPVRVEYPASPHRVGDFVVGVGFAIQLLGWGMFCQSRWRFKVMLAVAVLLLVYLRWIDRQWANVLLGSSTVFLIPVMWSRLRGGAEKLSVCSAALAPLILSMDRMIGQARPWMEVSRLSAGIALLGIFAAGVCLIQFRRGLVSNSSGESERQRVSELDWFIKWGAVWLAMGFILAAVSGENARQMFESSVLARARTAAGLVELDGLKRLLGLEMKLERFHVWRRPSGTNTEFAHAVSHATIESLPIRDTLRRIQMLDPAVSTVFIATLRGNNMVLCLAPHEDGRVPAADPDHFSYVTVQREATPQDRLDFSQQRERFEVRLDTSYDEVAIARTPLVHPEVGMLGWLEIDLPLSLWVAPQARAHLQAILAVLLGLVVLALLSLQRWRAHQRAEAEHRASVAREASELKNLFMAKVSHELRTPLQGIMGYGEMLRSSVLESDQRRFLDTLLDQGLHLKRMVDDLIDFGAIESGGLKLRSEPTAILEAVRQSLEVLRPTAIAKGLIYKVHVSEKSVCWAWVDPQRLRQIVLNVAANAVKFTAKGRVETWISHEVVDNRCRLMVEVTDTGPGIRAEDQAKLFQPFSRLAEAEGEPGAGLGLAIANELCQVMHGSINITSNGLLGSTFRIQLEVPLAKGADNDTVAERSLDDQPLAGKRILIADDNAFVRRLYSEFLSQLGAQCDVVDDGAQAVGKASKSRYAAILLDQLMPRMSGDEAAQAIRSAPLNSSSRIILCSASAKEPSESFDLHLVKPVSLADLAAAVCSDSEKKISPPSGMEQLLASFRRTFQEEASGLLDALTNYVDERDWTRVARASHDAKNSADIIGERELGVALGELERAAEVHDQRRALAGFQVVRTHLRDRP